MPSAVGGADEGVGVRGGYRGPPPGNFDNSNSIWCTLVKSWGSFMQKETTINEKKLYMHRLLLIPYPNIGIIYHIILFLI